MRHWIVVLAMVCGCGDALPEIELAASVSVQGLTQSEVSSLDAVVLSPRLDDDTILTCVSLMSNEVDARGSSVEALARATVSVVQGEAVEILIDSIEEGPDRLLFVEALGQSQEVVGRGCAENIDIEGGQTAVVDLVVSD